MPHVNWRCRCCARCTASMLWGCCIIYMVRWQSGERRGQLLCSCTAMTAGRCCEDDVSWLSVWCFCFLAPLTLLTARGRGLSASGCGDTCIEDPTTVPSTDQFSRLCINQQVTMTSSHFRCDADPSATRLRRRSASESAPGLRRATSSRCN
jgi:hypothetical protein